MRAGSGVKVYPSAQYRPSPSEAHAARARAGSQPHAMDARCRCTPCSNRVGWPAAGPLEAGPGPAIRGGAGPAPTTAAMALKTRSARPGKRCVSIVIAGAQSVTSARAPATAASATRADRSASARSATHAGAQRARAKAAAQETRTSAASADRAESRRVALCARRAVRRDATTGEPAHNSESFTKRQRRPPEKGRCASRQDGGGGWRAAPQARGAGEKGPSAGSLKASRAEARTSASCVAGSGSSSPGGGEGRR